MFQQNVGKILAEFWQNVGRKIIFITPFSIIILFLVSIKELFLMVYSLLGFTVFYRNFSISLKTKIITSYVFSVFLVNIIFTPDEGQYLRHLSVLMVLSFVFFKKSVLNK